MSTDDPYEPGPEQPGPGQPGPGQQGGGPPSFEKQPPPPEGAPSGSPYDVPPPAPGAGSGYGEPGGPLPGMPPLGGLGRRLLARIIDAVLVGVVCALAVGWAVDWNSRNGEATLSFTVGLVYWVYESLMLSRDGRTVGKMATKVRVAMLADGTVPTSGAAWTRAAVYSLPSMLCCGLWVIIDGIWCVFDKPYRQCLHDKAVKSVVVSTR
jgi:uncharacterized RDD family membrane protein YckC